TARSTRLRAPLGRPSRPPPDTSHAPKSRQQNPSCQPLPHDPSPSPRPPTRTLAPLDEEHRDTPPPDQRRLVRWGRCVHCSVHASHVPCPFRRVSAAPARHRSTSPTARAVGPPSNPLRTVSSNQLKAMPAPAATSRNRMVVREFISEEDALERVVDRRGRDPDDDASGELM